MGAISDAATFSALHRQLTAASMRQTVAAGNLANLDTPGFRAREVDFDKVLDGTLAGGWRLATTNPAHLAGTAVTDPAIVESSDAPARRDGNTVQLDRELLTMSRAASDFAAAQTALAAKFRMVRYAINEAK